MDLTERLIHATHPGSPEADKIADLGMEAMPKRHLPIALYLDTVSYLLNHDPNWQMLDFILSHFPDQLADKHLFCACGDEMGHFVAALCRQISERSPWRHVQHIPSGIRTSDILVRSYSLLSVLLSFRRFLSKQLQEAIVSAFIRGLQGQSVTTKPCVHALYLCCYELSSVMAKMLPAAIERLSRIVSSPDISVHLLEFLLSLSRLPKLCANFVQLDYQLVFGVALQFIKYSRKLMTRQKHDENVIPAHVGDAKTTAPFRPSREQDTNPAFSEYVLMLAYLNLIVWFLRIPLLERPHFVKFIIKHLISANEDEGSLDEQGETIMDMLSRYAFANYDAKPKNLPASIEGILADSKLTDTKHWVVGHSVVTIKVVNSLGWAEVTVHRASGTTSMILRIENSSQMSSLGTEGLTNLFQAMNGFLQINGDAAFSDQVLSSVSDQNLSADNCGLSILSESDALRQLLDLPPEESSFVSRRPSHVSASQSSPVPSPVSESSHPLTPTLPDAMAVIASSMPSRISDRTRSLDSTPFQNQLSSNLIEGSPDINASEGRRRYHSFQLAPNDSLTVPTNIEDSVSPLARKMSIIASHSLNSAAQGSAEISGDAEKGASTFAVDVRLSDPSFILLQVLNLADNNGDYPIRLNQDDATKRSINNLERIPVIDLNKIGIVYVGPGQRTEAEILSNVHGSSSYNRFLESIGKLIRLKQTNVYTGGLDTEMDLDGSFAYYWNDEITHIIFHCATLMPTNHERDPSCTMKKRHIGNDFVTIVYNDSGDDYAFDTMTSQFNFCQLVITPLTHVAGSGSSKQAALAKASPDLTYFRVHMQYRSDVPPMGPVQEAKVLSLTAVPEFVRSVALHANVYCQVFLQATERRMEYVSNWKERLRQIKRIRERALPNQTSTEDTLWSKLDFTRYA